MSVIERREGDHGPDAVVDVLAVRDVNGEPVTSGLRMVVGQFMSGDFASLGTALLDADMQHLGDGDWRWTPQEGDLRVGRWRLELAHDTVTIPSASYGVLLVRPTLPRTEV